MRTISRAVATFAALAMAATVSGTLPAFAAPNPNSTTRGNSAAVKTNANPNRSENGNQPSNNSGKNLEARQSACNQVRASIANRTANLQSSGERHLAVIDKVYVNLTDFKDKQGLELSQADKDHIAEARTAAERAILNLGQNEDNLNCEDKNVGQAAAAVRLSVQDVNTSLKQYRETVGDAIKNTRKQLNQKGQK